MNIVFLSSFSKVLRVVARNRSATVTSIGGTSQSAERAKGTSSHLRMPKNQHHGLIGSRRLAFLIPVHH